ncbi:PDR-type ABC transporter 2 [Heracleum sosnowskyi]|uniref:PDR-type ABC transporter 2 n=1 Tax=Heracleum sosnowskyi TaxID=360622 RepID=A0AAD8N0C7_9APIA|nr:PDR-type ABC transporter 2 [Heracleum sosnowskyi]KAK1391202.1 PDR-type ABC transporter 2 [Heracleum sosnowskyi]
MPQEMKDQGVSEERLLLLKGVSGAFRPGVLTALMGVSGAGFKCNMKSPNYKKNDFTETNEQGDEYSENRLKKYLEHNSKLRKIYEEQIVAEKSLSEIIAGKWRMKHDAQMREKYKDRKIRSGLYLLMFILQAAKIHFFGKKNTYCS